ncbi:MAG: HupE/UreJ family protein [Chitinophagaceae bacterium]|nr:HupE/UreJ family protein [Chitinophagaceae bacterium]
MVATFFATPLLFAHNINYALEKAPGEEVIWFYLRSGFGHIIPYGADHILFVTGLCLPGTRVKTIVWQATAFTFAHSVTLALSMANIIVAPPAIIEPVIALSIVFVAVENILFSGIKTWRIAIVFLFGLVHGMGFASALNETGLPRKRFYTSLLSFNGGVELGQLAVIAAVFALIIIPLRKKAWYKKAVVNPLSVLIALIAAYWAVQRVFF